MSAIGAFVAGRPADVNRALTTSIAGGHTRTPGHIPMRGPAIAPTFSHEQALPMTGAADPHH